MDVFIQFRCASTLSYDLSHKDEVTYDSLVSFHLDTNQ